MSKIFSPGKLMLTSEYFAIDGALVLAVPTQLGQTLFFEEIHDGKANISWKAFHQDQLWLNACLNYKSWEILETNLPEAASFIVKVLRNVQQLSSEKLHSDCSYRLSTNLEFPADFGLGSSSTLMNNLAEWAQINPYILNQESLGGSGYDIAVAHEKSAVLYKNKPEISVERIAFNPSFKEDLIFIHLNQKQDTREGIRLYKSKQKSAALIDEFTNLTKEIVKADDLEYFSALMMIHEKKIADFLNVETSKEKYFKECPVFIKSLGAWGGDFVMASKFDGYRQWFSDLGFLNVFNWSDLID